MTYIFDNGTASHVQFIDIFNSSTVLKYNSLSDFIYTILTIVSTNGHTLPIKNRAPIGDPKTPVIFTVMGNMSPLL